MAYNFRDGLSHEGNYSGTPGINVIGNYYKRGPSEDDLFPFCFKEDVPYYLRDNFIKGVGLIQDHWAEADKHDGLQYYADKEKKQEKETPVPDVTTHPPKKAYNLILNSAGCFPRDAVTRRVVRETRNGTGKWGRNEPEGGLMAGFNPKKPEQDSDGDGMPDAWKKHGLDPEDTGDTDKVVPEGASGNNRHAGYTYIEYYINQRADRRLKAVTDGK